MSLHQVLDGIIPFNSLRTCYLYRRASDRMVSPSRYLEKRAADKVVSGPATWK